MSADVEFLHGVPVHPNERGAEAIIDALFDAGFVIVSAKIDQRTRTIVAQSQNGALQERLKRIDEHMLKQRVDHQS